MNNRFKFRVWNKLSNIMTYNFMMGNFFQKSLDDYEKKDWIGLNYEPEYICFINEAIENLIVMQCTGLKDKNGTLIYEGDILKVADGSLNGNILYFTKPVKWEINRWVNCPYWIYRETDNTHFVEVIGNIYENPELLQECE